MTWVPNIISILRMLFSFILLLTEPLGALFLVIYSFCGLSDVLDGYIARRTRTESVLGETLDSIADFTMIAILLILIVPIINLTIGILIWIGAIGILRIVSLMITYVKFDKVTILHTHGNKVTGFLLFLLPFMLALNETSSGLLLVCLVATLSAVEELAIHLLSDDLVVNRKSLLDLNQRKTDARK